MFQNVSRGKYCPQDPLGFAEVQFPDFVLTQFLCFGTNFVAFASIIIQSPSARVKILTYFQCWTKGRRSTATATVAKVWGIPTAVGLICSFPSFFFSKMEAEMQAIL